MVKEKLKVSKMTGKLLGLQAINTSSLDNNFCNRMSLTDSVCKHCYSRTMLKGIRKNCRPSWKTNGELLSKQSIGIDYNFPKFNTELIRLSAHGELINTKQLINMLAIVNDNPTKQFTLWTKRKDIINRYFSTNNIPTNLILVYSESKLNKISTKIPKHFNKVFIVHDKNTKLKKSSINCGAKSCLSCKLCYTNNNTTIVNELLK